MTDFFPKNLQLKRICCYKEYQHAAVWKVIIKDLLFGYLLQEKHDVDI